MDINAHLRMIVYLSSLLTRLCCLVLTLAFKSDLGRGIVEVSEVDLPCLISSVTRKKICLG